MAQVLGIVSLLALAALALACGSETEDPSGDGDQADAAAGAGTRDAGPPAADAAPPADVDRISGKLIFVTSTQHMGALGGLGGADSVCDDRAGEAGLPGTFKAWVSSGDTSAAERLEQATVPYVRTDGVKVADDWADLVDGSIDAPINRDEDGAEVAGDVWTGTISDASADPATCDGFTDAGSTGRCGDSGASNSKWTDNIVPDCTTTLRLYCLQQ